MAFWESLHHVLFETDGMIRAVPRAPDPPDPPPGDLWLPQGRAQGDLRPGGRCRRKRREGDVKRGESLWFRMIDGIYIYTSINIDD